jgi:hypothetical protein
MGDDFMLSSHPFDQHLYLATGFLFAKKARRNHPGIVKHQQVARLEKLRKFTENPVVELAGKTVKT